MSAAPPTAASIADPPIEPQPSPFWPTLIWMLIQLALLVLGACRIPLSARWPMPAEKLALHEMAIGQIIAASLFLPILFRTFTSSVMVICSAPLFLLLAAAVAAWGDTVTLVWCCVYVCFWLITCAIWSAALRSPASKMYLVAGAVLLSAGGAAMAYLRREFALPSQSFEWSSVAAAGPATGAVMLLEAGPRTGTVWAELGFFLVSGVFIWVGSRFVAWRGAKRGLTLPPVALPPTASRSA